MAFLLQESATHGIIAGSKTSLSGYVIMTIIIMVVVSVNVALELQHN